jgi:hypothetical protein
MNFSSTGFDSRDFLFRGGAAQWGAVSLPSADFSLAVAEPEALASLGLVGKRLV